jgi:hypothetical protein
VEVKDGKPVGLNYTAKNFLIAPSQELLVTLKIPGKE